MTLWAVCAREDVPHFRILCLATSCHVAKNNKLNFLVTTGEAGWMICLLVFWNILELCHLMSLCTANSCEDTSLLVDGGTNINQHSHYTRNTTADLPPSAPAEQ